MSQSNFEAYSRALELNTALRPLVAKLHRSDRREAAQLKEAAKSVVRNLAEGNRRLGRDRRHLFSVAAGSADEVRAGLHTSLAWGELHEQETKPALELVDRVLAITYRLIHPR
ncbi:MAG: four helix bundle protein [Planctomycetota bacterium]